MPTHEPNGLPRLVAAVKAAPSRATTVAKALVAGASVAVAAAIPLVGDGLSAKDALIIVGAFLAGGFPTWVVPNAAAE